MRALTLDLDLLLLALGVIAAPIAFCTPLTTTSVATPYAPVKEHHLQHKNYQQPPLTSSRLLKIILKFFSLNFPYLKNL